MNRLDRPDRLDNEVLIFLGFLGRIGNKPAQDLFDWFRPAGVDFSIMRNYYGGSDDTI